MKIINLVLLVLSLISTIHSKTLFDKYNELSSKSKSSNGVIKLNTKMFNELVMNPNRDFELAIQLTALDDRMQCLPCKKFDPEFKSLSKQLRKSKPKTSILFTSLDFMDGQETFAKLGINTAPTLFFFNKHSLKPQLYDFNRQGFMAERIATFLDQNSENPITYKRPVDHTKLVTSITATLAILIVGKLTWKSHTRNFVYSKWSWATGIIVLILTMTSGYMWNQIRKPPQMVMTPSGPQYFANGATNQFKVETSIIGTIYGLCALCIVILSVQVPKIQNESRQRLAVYLWTIILVMTFSSLVYIFKLKQPIYPFRLFI